MLEIIAFVVIGLVLVYLVWAVVTLDRRLSVVVAANVKALGARIDVEHKHHMDAENALDMRIDALEAVIPVTEAEFEAVSDDLDRRVTALEANREQQ